jgi:hypothetical protein
LAAVAQVVDYRFDDNHYLNTLLPRTRVRNG